MRVIMGVWRSKDGVYYVRKKVPAKLEQAVATVRGVSRSRMVWLKKSLRTKDVREANIKAKPVLVEFDRILARATALLKSARIWPVVRLVRGGVLGFLFMTYVEV